MLPADCVSHNEIKNIFNSNILDKMDSEIKTIHHDLNFMSLFCFGTQSELQPNSIDDILKTVRISGRTALEYAGMIIEDDGISSGISFLMTYKLKFNINTGVIGYDAEYIDFDESYDEVVKSTIWELFKNEFMRFYATNKIEKKLNDLTFLDAPIVQMMNI